MALRVLAQQELDNGRGGVATIYAVACPHCGHTARTGVASPADQSKRARAEAEKDAYALLAGEFPKGRCPVCTRAVDGEEG